MGIQTENYDLTLPSPEDYNIFKEHNENMIIIDSQLKKLEREKEAVVKKKSAFNKDFEADANKIEMNGIADVGISDTIARGDHVHPTDTSRAAATHKHDGVYETASGVQKKIDEHANQAEPHVGHISHSMATAPNDFLVASKAGQFVKKTTDEVKRILGFGTAAYTNANDFATAEQGEKANNALPASSYTANDVLAKLKTVDGNASGLDADLLDGKEASAFATAEQGKKADNAATQVSFDSHMTDYVLHKNAVGTETTVGHTAIADAVETENGIVNNKAISPKNLKAELDKKVSNSLATAASQFMVSSAVGQWAVKTIADVKSLLGLKSAAYTESTVFATADQGAKADNALPATSYTANDVLTKIKTVAGSGSKLDADLLDGKEAAAFATAEQGAKADASATQISLDAHLADTLYPHGYPPAVNLLPDSGRFMGKINPLSCANSANFATSNMFMPYNGASGFTSAGKFIQDNSSYGGSSGFLAQDVIDLLAKMEGLGVRVEKRYGAEYYIGQTTSGNGTYSGGFVKDYYLLTSCNCMAFSGKYATSSFWIRLKNEGSLCIRKNYKLIKNGIIQNDNVILSSSDGWTHIETTRDFGAGYNNAFPYIFANGAGVVVQIALPAVVAGSKGVGLHTAPVPTINEMSI